MVDASALPLLRVAACSYEGSLFGWNVQEDQEQLELSATLNFGFNVTLGALKAVACSLSGKFLVVGGMDERIRIFDMKDNKSVGELSQHTGAITALKFFNDAYLISASEDFTLCIWRVYDWQCVHILGGHKDTIHDFSIHPTGKMALSVSKDHTLKLWNLVQGRCAFTRRLKHPTDQVIWHHTGDYYLLVSAKNIELFKASDNSNVATLTHGSRINRACFTTVQEDGAQGWRMVTVCDNKTVNFFDFSGKQTACVDLTSLGSGRPRDVFSSTLNAAAVQHPDMHAMVATERECLTIVTSQGQLLVLSANRLEQLGMLSAESDTAEESDADATPESALLSSHQLRAEPRLTAMVAWNPATAAAHAAAKGNKRARPMLENESAPASGEKNAPSAQGDQNSEDDAESDDQEAARKEKKRLAKKAKREAARSAEAAVAASAPMPEAKGNGGKAGKGGKETGAAVQAKGLEKKKGLEVSDPPGKNGKKQGGKGK